MPKQKQLALIFRPPDEREFSLFIDGKLDEMVNVEKIYCNSWTDLTCNMKFSPKIIVFYESMIGYNNLTVHEFINMLSTFIKCVPECKDTKLVTLINAKTEHSTIKALQKTDILGVIPDPSDFGTEETIQAIEELSSCKQHWPKNIMAKLPGYVESKQKLKEIHLTDRQQQVFELISKRGLSNKQIAKMLNISESTVKIHVSAVMKHFCVRNRTQLALMKI
jgi:DNA-binding NarL/FixJ family response regulator